jgi:hypothetical protein
MVLPYICRLVLPARSPLRKLVISPHAYRMVGQKLWRYSFPYHCNASSCMNNGARKSQFKSSICNCSALNTCLDSLLRYLCIIGYVYLVVSNHNRIGYSYNSNLTGVRMWTGIDWRRRKGKKE